MNGFVSPHSFLQGLDPRPEVVAFVQQHLVLVELIVQALRPVLPHHALALGMGNDSRFQL